MPRLALVTILSLLARVALAQESHPAMDARGYLTIDGSQTIGHEEMSFGLGSLDWGHGVPGDNDLVSATLVAALGLNLVGVPLELGASLPVSIASGATNAQGLGDAGVHLKLHLATLGPVGLGAIASIYAPTSSSPMFGNTGVTPELTGVADVALGRWRFAVNGGVRHGTLAMDDAMASTQFPAGVAGAWALVPQKFEVVAEAFTDDVSTHQLQALGGVKLYLARNSYLALGAGRGLASDASAAGTPDFRALIGIVFEPKPAPQVQATVPDAPDVVPDEPVRKQVVAQPDPPPPDIDYSAIPDTSDGCTHDKPTDDADCPDRKSVVVGKTDIVILKSIEFEFDKAIIQKESYPILDAVALALHDNPDIEIVEVRGHTDERGDDAYNLDLSDRRAAAVVQYLIGKGIAPDRLTSTGFGDTMPLDPRHNEAAWAKNRRVEFQIRKRNGELL